jgi:hypothetical protein
VGINCRNGKPYQVFKHNYCKLHNLVSSMYRAAADFRASAGHGPLFGDVSYEQHSAEFWSQTSFGR